LSDVLGTITLIIAIIVVACSGNIGEEKEYYINDENDKDEYFKEAVKRG